ncbi:77 kDa echinoderm microtubule-associated protein-like [Sycon ciliatum]|uniref:77 kDa echinoderm microtubule-associated protein-like n=1 Tax=Sycon ciliatum TaxID=27933 RepID=UPI0020AB4C52|eukprot:scpid26006/ scgid24377/ 77 kDa echinoderm microtubule-associated protein
MADISLEDLAQQVASLSARLESKESENIVLQNAVANLSNRLGACEAELKEVKSAKPSGGSGRTTSTTSNRRPPPSVSPAPAASGSGRPPSTSSASSNASTTNFKPPAASGGSSRMSIGVGRRTGTAAPREDGARNRSSVKDKSTKEKSQATTRDEHSMRMYLRGRPVTLYAPTGFDMGTLDQPAKPPGENIALQWVYGYRGRDCRNNLFYLPSGELLYFIAAVGVIYNPSTQSQRHYQGHNDDIKAMALHPNNTIAATGQVAGHDKQEGKPHVRVWNVETLETLAVIGAGSFDRGFSAIGFSQKNDGAYLFAVDESNDRMLSVWEWQKNKKLAETKSHGDAVLGGAFNPGDDNAIVTYGKQHMLFWTLENGKLSKKSALFEKHSKPKFISCIAFNADNEVISGDSNGNLFVWSNHKIARAIKDVHEGGVFSATSLPDGRLLTGGKDQRVIAWNADLEQTGDSGSLPEASGAVRTIVPGEEEGQLYIGTTRNGILKGSLGEGFATVINGHSDELWGLAVHPSENLFISAGYDKTLTCWNSDTHECLWTTAIAEEAQSADIHPDGSIVVVGLKSGRWMVFDGKDGKFITSNVDGNEQHDSVKFSPDGKKVALGSHDNYIYVYNVSEDRRTFERHGRCAGHSSFITHVDWSADSQNLKSCSGDYELLFWDANTCKQATSAVALRDAEWATYTTILGFDVAGIWPEGADGTDINTVGRNNGSSLVATGDDFGKVNLFRFPAPQAKSESRAAHGHSSHVTCVRFIHDDRSLLSTGGKDTSIMQWKVCTGS